MLAAVRWATVTVSEVSGSSGVVGGEEDSSVLLWEERLAY